MGSQPGSGSAKGNACPVPPSPELVLQKLKRSSNWHLFCAFVGTNLETMELRGSQMECWGWGQCQATMCKFRH